MTVEKPNETWVDATWAGNRRRQQREFQALSFREKIIALEEMERVSKALRLPDLRLKA